ncbi:hypothetical protein [Photobacterium sanguinicancri]|uniref:hypothetical protein n=1 Tax=Photobacterium sanguinicancri TaxID=875932 RepID=UPI0026E3B583|nr:hypothetical protein [Photobacterium sanguinicancri]MDO6497346.1 hypothetical protein [Photobacterium sanguinicancri]
MASAEIRIQLLSEPKGYHWKEINDVIAEQQATHEGPQSRVYEFHSHGGASEFVGLLEKYEIDYKYLSA